MSVVIPDVTALDLAARMRLKQRRFVTEYGSTHPALGPLRDPIIVIVTGFKSLGMYNAKMHSGARFLICATKKLAQLAQIPCMSVLELDAALGMLDNSEFCIPVLPNYIDKAIETVTSKQIVSWYNTAIYALPNASRNKFRLALLNVLLGKMQPENLADNLAAKATDEARQAVNQLIVFLQKEGRAYCGIMQPDRKGQWSLIPMFEQHYFSKMRLRLMPNEGNTE